MALEGRGGVGYTGGMALFRTANLPLPLTDEALTAYLAEVGSADDLIASQPLLWHAIMARNPRQVALLLGAGADPLTEVAEDPNLATSRLLSLAKVAISPEDDAETLTLLLAARGSRKPPCETEDLLLRAAEMGASRCCAVLLDHGSNPDVPDHMWAHTPLMRAMDGAGKDGHATLEATRTLLQRGANPNAHSHELERALSRAANHGLIEHIELLLAHGAEPQFLDDDGNTLLHVSLLCQPCDTPEQNARALATCEILLQRGLDLQARNPRGYTPFHFAAHTRGPEVLSRLLELGAQLHDVNEKQNTALHMAASADQCEGVRWLLEQGLDGGALNVDGLTAEKMADQDGYLRGARAVRAWRDQHELERAIKPASPSAKGRM